MDVEKLKQRRQHSWDFETMKLALVDAGFSKIYKMAYLQSRDPRLEIDLEVRQYESLYVEAIK